MGDNLQIKPCNVELLIDDAIAEHCTASELETLQMMRTGDGDLGEITGALV